MRTGTSARQQVSSKGTDAATDDGSILERRLFQRIDKSLPLVPQDSSAQRTRPVSVARVPSANVGDPRGATHRSHKIDDRPTLSVSCRSAPATVEPLALLSGTANHRTANGSAPILAVSTPAVRPNSLVVTSSRQPHIASARNARPAITTRFELTRGTACRRDGTESDALRRARSCTPPASAWLTAGA